LVDQAAWLSVAVLLMNYSVGSIWFSFTD